MPGRPTLGLLGRLAPAQQALRKLLIGNAQRLLKV